MSVGSRDGRKPCARHRTRFPRDPSIIQQHRARPRSRGGAVLTTTAPATQRFPHERTSSSVPRIASCFFHVAGTTLGILLGYSPAPRSTRSRFDPSAVLDTIERTMYNGVDSLFITLLKHPGFRRSALSSVRGPPAVRHCPDGPSRHGIAGHHQCLRHQRSLART